MVKIWRPGDNFCVFERILEMADLNFFFALMKKRQFFCYPTIQTIDGFFADFNFFVVPARPQ
jgi:hypothetical protein